MVINAMLKIGEQIKTTVLPLLTINLVKQMNPGIVQVRHFYEDSATYAKREHFLRFYELTL